MISEVNIANSVSSFFKIYVMLLLMLELSDCAEIGLTVPAAAVSGGAAGVNYSFTNIAYKTISYPVNEVEAALNNALIKMDIKETVIKKEEDKVSIHAVTSKLDIYVDLEKITPTVTKIEVNAKKGFFLRDKSTATEIIVQTEKNLEEKK